MGYKNIQPTQVFQKKDIILKKIKEVYVDISEGEINSELVNIDNVSCHVHSSEFF